MRITLRVYYKRIIIDGIDNLPKEGAVILASNHPNSFLDSIILGCHMPHRLYYIARSDVFNSSWKQWILGKIQLIPIYRLQEGIENLDKNKDTFKRCHELLDHDAWINIFGEGICIQEKRLRKLKKGTARIALDFVSESNKPLHIVAVGMNYMEPMKFRKEVIIGLNTPFDAQQITPRFNENPPQSILAFNNILTEKLKEVVIHIEDKSKEKQVDELILAKRKKIPTASGFRLENTGILKQLVDYTSQLNITESLPQAEVSAEAGKTGFTKLILQVIAFLGILLNGLPLFAAKKLTQNKVKLKEFKDSVIVAGGMIFSLLYCIILVIVLGIINPTLILPVLGIMALTATISVWCYDQWTNNR